MNQPLTRPGMGVMRLVLYGLLVMANHVRAAV